MKSCLGLLFMLMVFVVVLGGGALIWYLSDTTDFSRTGTASTANTNHAPQAIPVNPGTNSRPQQPILVHPDPKIPTRSPRAVPVPNSNKR